MRQSVISTGRPGGMITENTWNIIHSRKYPFHNIRLSLSGQKSDIMSACTVFEIYKKEQTNADSHM